MKGFWKSLSQVAQGQLFSGGYLSHEAVQRLSTPRKRGKTIRVATTRRKPTKWPRLAIPH